MAKTLGIGERVAERMRAKGYVTKDGRLDVTRFCEEYSFIPSYLYRWLAGETPKGLRLFRLAAALDVDPKWLLTGPKKRPVSTAGGSAAAKAPQKGAQVTETEHPASYRGIGRKPLWPMPAVARRHAAAYSS